MSPNNSTIEQVNNFFQMGLFSFFKPLKPVGFGYQPRFYDEKKEERMERRKAAEELQGQDPEALKSRIKRNMRRQSSSLASKSTRQQQVAKSNMRLLLIIAVLIAALFLAIEVYLPRFAYLFE
jgi:uncharacterized membrane protein (DUF106 family)